MRRVEAMVPQDHAPGAEAEVDFGEVYVILDGVKTKGTAARIGDI